MNPTLMVVFIGSLTFTSYRSVSNQTDSTPFYTSTNERVHSGGVAVSQDRLCGACRKLHKRCKHPEYQFKVHYGDCLYLEGVGFKIVNDCMGRFSKYIIRTKEGIKVLFKRQDNWLDVWVPTLMAEKEFHKTKGIHRYPVWRITFLKEN